MTTVAFTLADLGRQRANQRGIVLMIAAMACFVVNDSVAKLATARMPVSEVIAIRGVFATAFVLTLILASGLQRHFRLIWQWRVAARGGMENFERKFLPSDRGCLQPEAQIRMGQNR